MDSETFQAAAQRQQSITENAARATLWRTALTLDDKEARFPGFHQRTVNYKAGQQIVKGGLRLPVDLVMHESVPMLLSDGIKLYSDVFLPSRFQNLKSKRKDAVPAIIAWSPYGKQQGMTTLDDFTGRAGVPREWTSGLEKWEAPDPAYWCENDYAVVNVDTRGAYTSEGDFVFFGHKEAKDGGEFITWVSEQPWCNGKVALSGNSWLAITQWSIGSLRPKGLAALAPWEGFHDYYRYHLFNGGICCPGFHQDVARAFCSQGKIEDPVAYAAKHPLIDDYWEDKRSHPEWINVPTYVASSWTNPVHTPGTIKAWNLLPDNIPKWLRIHDRQEWSDFYNADSRADLKRFYDFFLHGKIDNGWDQTPEVRLTVHNTGMTGLADIVNRPESSFPLSRTKHTKYYLQSNQTLALKPSSGGTLRYDSTSGAKLVFEYEMPSSCETTGYFMAHLLVSSPSHNEIDIYVQVEKFSPKNQRQGILAVKPNTYVLQRLMQFIHDWQIGLGFAGMAFHWGPDGQFRASFSASRVEAMSKVAEPYYSYTAKKPLERGEVRAIDVPMRPYGMNWEKGSILRLSISGKRIVPFAIPGLLPDETNNKGSHVIQCADRTAGDASYILVPHVE